MKTKDELFTLLDELKYAEVFENLDLLGCKGQVYETLRTEFMQGVAKFDITFNDRLKTLVGQFLAKFDITFNDRLKTLVGQFFLHPTNYELNAKEKAATVQNAENIFNIDTIQNFTLNSGKK